MANELASNYHHPNNHVSRFSPRLWQTEDEAILSPRNSFVLPDAEFTEQQAKLRSRFNERPPSPGEPRSRQLRHAIGRWATPPSGRSPVRIPPGVGTLEEI